MIGAIFCFFRPLVQSLNYGWDLSSRGLSSHKVPIRFLSARGIHTAVFLWGPSFFFSSISVASSWVVALMLASPWPPSFCLRVLYLEFSSLRRYRVYIWVLPSPSTASLLYQRGIWCSHLLCQSGWSNTTVSLPSHQPSPTCFPLCRIFRCLIPNCSVLVTGPISHFWPCQLLIYLLLPSPSPG